ncbi:MAG: DUF983 domain-containing protein [Bacteroidetes bacterium]|nr:MAG: DUF983 domain-containing protein [Bacteroidota bacterium]
MSGLSAFIGGKCPQCRKGNVFTHKGTNLRHFRDMNTHCPSCKVKFESEPGFFWGAMYFSYAYSVASFIIIGFFFFTLSDDVHLGYYIGTVIAYTLVTSPMSFRLSRLLMMYIAAPYRTFMGNYTANR